MKRKMIGSALFIVTALIIGTTAMAESPKVSCEQIQQALKSGKSQSVVAKDLKVPLTRVRECSKQAK